MYIHTHIHIHVYIYICKHTSCVFCLLLYSYIYIIPLHIKHNKDYTLNPKPRTIKLKTLNSRHPKHTQHTKHPDPKPRNLKP